MIKEHKQWVDEALKILRPITDGSDLTNKYQDVEKEAMRNILESVDELIKFLDTMPKGCECSDETCPGWKLGNDYAFPGEAPMLTQQEQGKVIEQSSRSYEPRD